MRFSRRATTALLAVLVLATVPLTADTAAYYEPPDVDGSEPLQARLVASRQFGFAPLTIRLSGMLETRGGDLFPIGSNQDVILTVESPFLYMQSTAGSYHIGTDYRLETTLDGKATPSVFAQIIALERPGRYVFRIHVVDESGTVVTSNEVTVKAL